MNKLRFVVKSFVHGAIDWSGRSRRQRRHLRGKLIILTYHSFCTDWPSGLFSSLPIERFERQLRFLKENFNLVSLSEGLDHLRQGHVEEKPWIAITIDDGFRDNYTHAWPVLKCFSIPATIFLATDFIDTGRPPWPTQLVEILERTKVQVMEAPFRAELKNPVKRSAVAQQLKKAWSPLSPIECFERIAELRRHLRVGDETHYLPLTWEQVREMHRSGICFGSHTVHHSILTRVSGDVAEDELRVAKWRIESELDEPCDVIAYPDGKYDASAINLIQAVGYKVALTQDFGPNNYSSDPYRLHRVEVPFHDPLVTFRARVSFAL